MTRKGLLLSAILLLVFGAAPAVAATPLRFAEPATDAEAGRSETVIETEDALVVSHVRRHVPMLPGSAPHPAACDYLDYVRYRSAEAPDDPQASDGVIVMLPGAWLGGMSLDRLARNTVRALAARGKQVEWWSPSRRSACVFDSHGLHSANEARDAREAFDYYFGGKSVDGKTFAGFPPDSQLGYLADMGAAQFAHDQYDLMRLELPDPEFRRARTLCGGHSDGGLILGIFAAWDFGGGRPETAGFNQCAGFFSYDSLVSADPVAVRSYPPVVAANKLIGGLPHQAVVSATKLGLLPRSYNGGPALSPEIWAYTSIMGLAARYAPDQESELNKLMPKTPLFEQTQRMLFSRTYQDAFLGTNSIRDFRFTNDALLGTWIDENHLNVAPLHMSLGGLSGGALGPKEVPWPRAAVQLPVLGEYLGYVSGAGGEKVGPTDTSALYTWKRYDEVQDLPFTSPEQEVVDIRDLAAQMSGDRVLWSDPYFPPRFTYDLAAIYSGDRSGELTPMRYDAEVKAMPILDVWGEDSWERAYTEDLILPKDIIYIPGYTHIDPIAGATGQNNGQPEPFTRHLIDYFGALAG